MKKLLRNMSGKGLLGLLGLVLVSLLLTGCETTSDQNIKFTPVEGEEDMTGVAMTEDARLAKGDKVKVAFSGVNDPIQPHEEQIKEDGTITLPLIGAVKAEGKTTGELQKEIQDKYVPDYYKRLIVTVSTDLQVYYVQGQVRTPGRQQYIGTTTVLKAVASAGDFTDFADRKRVVLTRADGKRLIVDCIKAAKDSTYDLPVYPGDKIEVKLRPAIPGF
jgi:protein involved in polysaccharide export with SLBB domain